MPSSQVEIALSSALLCVVVLLVLAGNTLVVAAVATTRKLRTVTNVFIVNLACADLLLGVLVLPFSAVLEIKDVWIFGHLWCQVWLAVDVWLCTTSILTLCCISLDRYLAITHPIRYPGLMSSRRAKTLVASVWLFSFIICCPPLIGWNDTSGELRHSNTSEAPDFSDAIVMTTQALTDISCAIVNNFTRVSNVNLSCLEEQSSEAVSKTCELTNSRGYRIYAALGSFFIPMLVMVFFYLQIYRAAVRTINAYEKGELKMKYSANESDDGSKMSSVTLRIHRGGHGGLKSCSWGGRGGKARDVSSNDKDKGGGSSAHKSIPHPRSSDASLVTLTDLTCEGMRNGNIVRSSPSSESMKQSSGSFCWKTDKRAPEHQERLNHNGNHRSCGRCMALKSQTARGTSLDSDDSSSGDSRTRVAKCGHPQGGSFNSSPLPSSSSIQAFDSVLHYNRSASMRENPKRLRISGQKPGQALRLHMQKFNREKKAAKTLAIIVGAFIVCWMPFFTIYLVGAFCDSCVSPLIFSIFFWLGYLNSAMNPCVYALFSKDFRYAFRKLMTCKAMSMKHSFRAQTSDVPAIQLQCAPNEEARSSSDIDGNWR
ncbi:octopamine receptor 1-like [Aplysia californica]|uniref:Octopamine receptor 1-like n=1 Tax=Aplysia californica TaxID=6500 RepID=A0ABM0ZZP5_APLCA|nr:octopamine receptor 1-like [Aplysia californica]